MSILKCWPPLNRSQLDAVFPQSQFSIISPTNAISEDIIHENAHCPSDFYLEVQQTEHKGLGVFAKRHVPASTKIVDAAAIMTLGPGEDLPHAYSQFQSFSASQRDHFLNLHAPSKLERDQLLAKKLEARGYASTQIAEMIRISSIFTANAFNVEDGTKRLFPTIARINHSCVPNAHTYYDSATERMTAYSLCDIEAGTEVQIAYFNLLLPREQRQIRSQGWGFKCLCPACESSRDDEQARHEEVRARIRQCEAAEAAVINGFGDTPAGLDRAVAAGYEMLDLVLEEDALKPQLPHAYDYLATLNLIRFKRGADNSTLPTIGELMEHAVEAEACITGPTSSATRRRREKLRAFAQLSGKLTKNPSGTQSDGQESD